MENWKYSFSIKYTVTDQALYHQDIYIHREKGISYEDVLDGLNVWHIFIDTNCLQNYGDIRFTDEYGTELRYYLWPDFTNSVAKFTVRLEDATIADLLMVWFGNADAVTTSNKNTYFNFFNAAEEDETVWTSYGAYPPALSINTQFGRDVLVLFQGSAHNGWAALPIITLPNNYSVRAQLTEDTTAYKPNFGICVAFTTVGPQGYTSTLRGTTKFTELAVVRNNSSSTTVDLYTEGVDLPKGVWYTSVVHAQGNSYISEIYDEDNDLVASLTWSESLYSTRNAVVQIARNVGYLNTFEVRAYSTTPPSAISFIPLLDVNISAGTIFGSANPMVV